MKSKPLDLPLGRRHKSSHLTYTCPSHNYLHKICPTTVQFQHIGGDLTLSDYLPTICFILKCWKNHEAFYLSSYSSYSPSRNEAFVIYNASPIGINWKSRHIGVQSEGSVKDQNADVIDRSIWACCVVIYQKVWMKTFFWGVDYEHSIHLDVRSSIQRQEPVQVRNLVTGSALQQRLQCLY